MKVHTSTASAITITIAGCRFIWTLEKDRTFCTHNITNITSHTIIHWFSKAFVARSQRDRNASKSLPSATPNIAHRPVHSQLHRHYRRTFTSPRSFCQSESSHSFFASPTAYTQSRNISFILLAFNIQQQTSLPSRDTAITSISIIVSASLFPAYS